MQLKLISAVGVLFALCAAPAAAQQTTSSFGSRSDPFNGRRAHHAGVDIAARSGTPVYATADAIVSRSEWAGGYGNLVELNHGGGYRTRFGHLSVRYVAAGVRVRRGQLIGLIGSTGRSTGPHLHYEVRINGSAVDPMPYIRGTAGPRIQTINSRRRIGNAHIVMGASRSRR